MAKSGSYSYYDKNGYCHKLHSLFEAIANQKIDGIKYFVNIDSQSVNKLDANGYTPVAYAACYSDVEIVKYLVDRGADVCKVGRNGKTPLCCAIEKRKLDLVTYLLENGAKYNVQSAFLTAIASTQLDIIKLLKEKGALVNYSYRNGYTPLIKAVETNDVAVVKYLVNNGADVKSSFHGKEYSYIMENIAKNNLEIVKVLCEAGLNLDSHGECNYTLLNKATEMEHFEIVRCLVEHGANINLVDGNQKSALAIAASNCSFRIFRYLVNSGADMQLAKTEIEEYISWNEDIAKYMASLQIKKREECGHEEDI